MSNFDKLTIDQKQIATQLGYSEFFAERDTWKEVQDYIHLDKNVHTVTACGVQQNYIALMVARNFVPIAEDTHEKQVAKKKVAKRKVVNEK